MAYFGEVVGMKDGWSRMNVEGFGVGILGSCFGG